MRDARSFIEAATHVCDEAGRLGIAECKVVLDSEQGAPAIAIASLQPGDERAHIDSLVLPVIGPDGHLGSVCFGQPTPIPIELERSLHRLVTELCVWCTDHGITAVPDDAIELSARQYEIGRLASRGFTNFEIAANLGISINTVKVRLKQLFARVNANNRTELALLLRRYSATRDVPVGVTRRETVTITRVAVTRRRDRSHTST